LTLYFLLPGSESSESQAGDFGACKTGSGGWPFADGASWRTRISPPLVLSHTASKVEKKQIRAFDSFDGEGMSNLF
jgi:hypothetical protein